MARDMLCYCLNLTYEDVKQLWREGYFNRPSDHHPGLYCTSCKGDLAWFLGQLAQEEGRRAGPLIRPWPLRKGTDLVCRFLSVRAGR